MSQSNSAESKRSRSVAQRSIRRRCKCGRVIVGNAAWHSHLSVNRVQYDASGNLVPTCGYDGRA